MQKRMCGLAVILATAVASGQPVAVTFSQLDLTGSPAARSIVVTPAAATLLQTDGSRIITDGPRTLPAATAVTTNLWAGLYTVTIQGIAKSFPMLVTTNFGAGPVPAVWFTTNLTWPGSNFVAAVTRILAGNNVTVSPGSGLGAVTIAATGSGGGNGNGSYATNASYAGYATNAASAASAGSAARVPWDGLVWAGGVQTLADDYGYGLGSTADGTYLMWDPASGDLNVSGRVLAEALVGQFHGGGSGVSNLVWSALPAAVLTNAAAFDAAGAAQGATNGAMQWRTNVASYSATNALSPAAFTGIAASVALANVTAPGAIVTNGMTMGITHSNVMTVSNLFLLGPSGNAATDVMVRQYGTNEVDLGFTNGGAGLVQIFRGTTNVNSMNQQAANLTAAGNINAGGTFSGNGSGLTNVGSVYIIPFTWGPSSLSSGATYYTSSQWRALDSESYYQMAIPVAGTITRVDAHWMCGNDDTSATTVAVNIRKAKVTVVGPLNLPANTYGANATTNASVAVAAGDLWSVQLVMPTFTTLPTYVIIDGYITVKTP